MEPDAMRMLYAADVKLVDISIEGNKRTKSHIIRHAARRVWDARTFGQLMRALNVVQARLQDLEIFDGAQITVDAGRNAPEEVAVRITVSEKNCTTLKTGTYVNAENAEGNMEGLYILRNYFGSAERFELSSAMGTSASNNFKFDFHKPTIGRSDVSLHGQINRASTQNPHSSYHEIETQASLCWNFPKLWLRTPGTVGFDICAREMYAGSAASAAIREHCALPLGYNTKATLNAILRHDSRDDPLAPTAGWAGTCGIDASLCDYMVSKHFIKPSFSMQLNRSLFDHYTLSASFSAGGIFIPFARAMRGAPASVGYVRVCDRFFLGNPKVRGFETKGLGPRAPRSVQKSPSAADSIGASANGDALGGDLFGAAMVSLSALVPHPKLAKYGVRWHLFANGGSLVERYRPTNVAGAPEQ